MSIAGNVHQRLDHLWLYLLAALVGAATGLIAAAFHNALDFADRCRSYLRLELADFTLPGPLGMHITGWLPLALVSAMLVILSLWLVRTFAPETHGSGIPQVEELLAGDGKLRWWRVLPVKFLGSVCAIAPGLLLGREGPTIHMGAACGQMVADASNRHRRFDKHLLAAGVAAGLAAAFNAPLAGIMLVTEEMRKEFEYNYLSLQCVILASCVAIIVSNAWLGQGLDLSIDIAQQAPLQELPLYFFLGIVVGIFAVIYNRALLFSVSWFGGLNTLYTYLAGGAVGVLVGVQLWLLPNIVGGGEHLVENLTTSDPILNLLLTVLLLRTLMSVICYGTGVPGGIFAPLLALGALLGMAFNEAIHVLLPELTSDGSMFIVASMGALFAGTVRAPLTGIVLVVELTGAFELILPIIITCLIATMSAAALAGEPIYSQLRGRD